MHIITKNIKKKQIKILIHKSKFIVDIFRIRRFIASKKICSVACYLGTGVKNVIFFRFVPFRF
jgi:hypothetical protein